jgi:hypothetical protein
MSFTTGGLFYQESVRILSEYQLYQDWSKTQEAVLANNLLQQKTINSSKRIFHEVAIRLKNLPQEYLNILKTGSRQDQLLILWISVCRNYTFIGEFARQVLREKYLGLDFQRVMLI